MTFIRKHFKLLAIAASAAAVGAGASAIATAGAASPSGSVASAHHGKRHGKFGRAVHGTLVVATKNGFVNVTFDRGVVQSVSGQQLTITEGNKTTHKTVTLTIPANAVVRVNKNNAKLSDVSQGQRVKVIQGPKGTRVIAKTPHNH
jgi:hypothetical protein